MTSSDASTRSEARPRTVFISYASADRDLADEIRRELTQAGIHVWSPEDEIPVGASLRQGIEEGLRDSDAAVIVLSTAAEVAPWTGMELAALIAAGASRGHPRLVPVLADQGAEVPPLLADLVYADASRPERRDAAVADVVRAVTEDRPWRGPNPDLLEQEFKVERFLLDARLSVFEARAATRREGARRILAITLGLSLIAMIAVSVFVGVGVLLVVAPAITSLFAAAIGFYVGGASRRGDDHDESADKVHHGH